MPLCSFVYAIMFIPQDQHPVLLHHPPAVQFSPYILFAKTCVLVMLLLEPNGQQFSFLSPKRGGYGFVTTKDQSVTKLSKS